MKSPSPRKKNTLFMWSKEYDQFFMSRMALVGEKYKSRKEAFMDVTDMFDEAAQNVSGRWRYFLMHIDRDKR